MAGNLSTNQRPAFGRKSLECDGTLITSEGPLGELTVPIWKQSHEQLGEIMAGNLSTNQTSIWQKITGA